MDFSRWTREKSIIAPSVKKYRVYTPIWYRGVKKRNYTPDGKKLFFQTPKKPWKNRRKKKISFREHSNEYGTTDIVSVFSILISFHRF